MVLFSLSNAKEALMGDIHILPPDEESLFVAGVSPLESD
jgi:hypothetical protein